MLRNLKEFSRLKSEWKKNWQKEIVDIFVFGSYVKGKSKPNDIDVCLVFRDKVDFMIVRVINTLLKEGKNRSPGAIGIEVKDYHVSSLSINNFFTDSHSLSKTILLEGKSIITGKPFAASFGLEAKLFYSYDLSKEEASKKVRFVYLLRGRGESEGLVKKWKGEFISKNAFFIPINVDNEVREVLDRWGIKYQRKKLMLMS